MKLAQNNPAKTMDDTAPLLTGYCIIFGIFVAGLVTNVVVAAKIVQFGPIALPSSVFIWAITYPCSDIIAEVYGRKYAQRMVLGGFVAFALAIIVVQLSVLMPAASFWPHQESYQTILSSSLRVSVTVIISYLITQFLDVYIFSTLRRKLKGKHLWLRNNVSTFVSQTTANIIFLTLAFAGTMPLENWLHLFTNNLMARYVLALSDTALVYMGVYILYRTYPALKKSGMPNSIPH